MHARGDAQILGRDHVDAIALMIPIDDASHEGMVAAGAQNQVDIQQLIAPIMVVDAFLQRCSHHRRAFEIHIGDAHARHDLAGRHMLVADGAIPFHAIGADAVIGRIEIVFSVHLARQTLYRSPPATPPKAPAPIRRRQARHFSEMPCDHVPMYSVPRLTPMICLRLSRDGDRPRAIETRKPKLIPSGSRIFLPPRRGSQ